MEEPRLIFVGDLPDPAPPVLLINLWKSHQIKVLVGFIRDMMRHWVGREFRYLVEGGLVEYKSI